MLSGAGVFDYEKGEKIVHTTFEGTVVSGSANDTVVVKKNDIAGYTPILSSSTEPKYDDFKTYAMVLDKEQVSVVDYLGSQEIKSTEINGSGDFVITLNGKNADYKDRVVRVDCYSKTTNAAVTTLTVDAEKFGGTFYIEAETLFRDEATGQDFPATFIIPKGKIQGNFTFSMASTGDPSTFDFTIDCTVGSVRGGEAGKKVLYAIDIIDTISTAEAHTETAKKDISSETATYPKA